MKIKIFLFSLALTLLFSCEDENKNQTPDSENPVEETDSSNNNIEPTIAETPKVIPHHFICYTSDDNPNLAISISFNEEEKALEVKYKGQETSMTLAFVKEDFSTGGAHPNIETYYSEIYEGKENGVYKLTHSGVWDYAEYTRSKDGKVFNFTIDHELTISGEGYRTSACF